MVEPGAVPGEPAVGATGFLPQVAVAAVANGVGTVTSAAAGLLIARALGPADRGVVAAATAWAGLLGLLASFGLVQAVTYYVARQPSVTRWLLDRTSAWVLPPTAAVAVAGTLFATVRFAGPTRYVYVAAFLSVPLTVLGGLSVAALQALRTTWWNGARLVQQCAYLVGIAAAFFAGRLRLETVALVIFASIALQLIVARALARAATDEDSAASPRPEGRDVLRYGAHNLFAALPNTVNARLDQAVLALITSRAEVGSYAVAVSLSLVAGPLAGAFGSIAFPRLASLGEERERQTTERAALLGTLVLAGLIGVLLAVFAGPIVGALFGHRFGRAVPLVRILAPAGVALACNMVLADVLRGRGRPSSPAAAEGASAVVTVVLLVFLTPRFGAVGAAWTSVVAYSLSTLVLLVFLRNARR